MVKKILLIDLDPSYYNWQFVDKRWAKYLAVWIDKPYFHDYFFYTGHCDMAGNGRILLLIVFCVISHAGMAPEQISWSGLVLLV